MSTGPLGLSAEEVRVLGALAEKAVTTPDTYPLSSNALRTACNQRSSREPVVDYDDATITTALLALRERALAKTIRGAGTRVLKHAHRLDETLELDAPQLAVVAVLALRGPQTVGELKTRTERQHRFGSLEEVEETLAGLAQHDARLVEMLEREPGKKEARWRHLLSMDPFDAPIFPAAAPPARSPKLEEESEMRAATLEEIAARVRRLEESLNELRRSLETP